MFHSVCNFNPAITLNFSLNSFVTDIIRSDESLKIHLDDVTSDEVYLSYPEGLTPNTQNRFLMDVKLIQSIIDNWYDDEAFVMTCTACNKFTDLEDWCEASAKRMDEDQLEDCLDEKMTCPHCRQKVTLGDMLYEDYEEGSSSTLEGTKNLWDSETDATEDDPEAETDPAETADGWEVKK